MVLKLRRKLMLVMLALLGAAVSGCVGGSAPSGDITDYFPAKTNAYYEYEYSGTVDIKQQRIYNMHISENRIQRLITTDVFPYTYTEVLEFSEGGLRMIYGDPQYLFFDDITSVNKVADMLILQGPLQVGAKWNFDPLHKSEVTSLSTRVTTPSGDYDALEVTITSNNLVQKEYYAKGIGLVKSAYTYSDGSAGYVMELCKLTEGAAYNVSCELYYPDGSGGQAAETRTITLNTNCDLAKIFEAEFKKPAASAGAALIGETVSISGFVIDWQSFTLALQTSEQLDSVTKDAVSRTLNEFFGTEEVSFTVG